MFVSLEDDLVAHHGVAKLMPASALARRDGPIDDPRVARVVTWGQHAVEGQCYDLRRTLWRYSRVLEGQRRRVRHVRDGWLDEPDRQRRHRALGAIDRLWAEHLEALADLQDGIHWVRLGSEDPMHVFLKRSQALFEDLMARLDGEIEQPTAPGLPLKGPSSTWTYLVDDDPLKMALGLHVSGNIALSIGAAVYWPLYMLTALYRRLTRRSP